MLCLRASKYLILFRVFRVSLSRDGYLCRTYRAKEKNSFQSYNSFGMKKQLSIFFYKKGEF